jgi:hypothetical protein
VKHFGTIPGGRISDMLFASETWAFVVDDIVFAVLCSIFIWQVKLPREIGFRGITIIQWVGVLMVMAIASHLAINIYYVSIFGRRAF